MNKKPFTTPIWWLAIIVVIQCLSYIATYISLRSFRNAAGDGFADQYERIMITQAISMAIVLVVQSVELVIYWKLRYYIVKRQLAIMHVLGLFVGFVVLPVLYSLYMAFGRDFIDHASTMNSIKMVLTWTFVIIAHGLFITVWIDTRKRRRAEALLTSGDGNDILNDYAER